MTKQGCPQSLSGLKPLEILVKLASARDLNHEIALSAIHGLQSGSYYPLPPFTGALHKVITKLLLVLPEAAPDLGEDAGAGP